MITQMIPTTPEGRCDATTPARNPNNHNELHVGYSNGDISGHRFHNLKSDGTSEARSVMKTMSMDCGKHTPWRLAFYQQGGSDRMILAMHHKRDHKTGVIAIRMPALNSDNVETLWEIETRQDYILSFAISPDQSRFAIIYAYGGLEIYATSSEFLTYCMAWDDAANSFPVDACFVHNEQLVIEADKGITIERISLEQAGDQQALSHLDGMALTTGEIVVVTEESHPEASKGGIVFLSSQVIRQDDPTYLKTQRIETPPMPSAPSAPGPSRLDGVHDESSQAAAPKAMTSSNPIPLIIPKVDGGVDDYPNQGSGAPGPARKNDDGEGLLIRAAPPPLPPPPPPPPPSQLPRSMQAPLQTGEEAPSPDFCPGEDQGDVALPGVAPLPPPPQTTTPPTVRGGVDVNHPGEEESSIGGTPAPPKTGEEAPSPTFCPWLPGIEIPAPNTTSSLLWGNGFHDKRSPTSAPSAVSPSPWAVIPSKEAGDDLGGRSSAHGSYTVTFTSVSLKTITAIGILISLYVCYRSIRYRESITAIASNPMEARPSSIAPSLITETVTETATIISLPATSTSFVTHTTTVTSTFIDSTTIVSNHVSTFVMTEMTTKTTTVIAVAPNEYSMGDRHSSIVPSVIAEMVTETATIISVPVASTSFVTHTTTMTSTFTDSQVSTFSATETATLMVTAQTYDLTTSHSTSSSTGARLYGLIFGVFYILLPAVGLMLHHKVVYGHFVCAWTSLDNDYPNVQAFLVRLFRMFTRLKQEDGRADLGEVPKTHEFPGTLLGFHDDGGDNSGD
ncbi:hypothetical protein BDN71DRAFT_1534701 [Pleurotus eryngii]|uniref:Uncharacterized protein n=1 Tax=Pleurotus eryngii TaxID=5323 RepID=A0A9P5ZI60_PLEER|nr:hypothetical protein BDN71DRAFT_1534701 [Pleurotus eryngii]